MPETSPHTLLSAPEAPSGVLPAVPRLPTGVPGLDTLLAGGLPAGRLYVLAGEPGAGKTILAHQMGAQVVAHGGMVLFLTVHTEAHHTLLAQARTLAFFDPAIVAAEQFRYVSLSAALDEGGIAAVRERLAHLVQTYAPTLLVLDGLHMLKLLGTAVGTEAGTDERAFQRFMIFLQAQATLSGITTLALTNYDGAAPADAMYAVPDGIVHLRTVRYGMREVRRLAVSKLRGSASLAGWHDYTLGAGGMRVFPRLEARIQAERLPRRQPSTLRAAFGVAGLDALLGGGVPEASVTLLAGAPGAGKTLMGLAFLVEGARRGERGLYLGFRETADRIVAKADGVGLAVGAMREAGLLDVEWAAPLELFIDALTEQLLRAVFDAPAVPSREPDQHPTAPRDAGPPEGALARFRPTAEPGGRAPTRAPVRRVFLDGLDDLRRTCLEADRLPSVLAALTDVLRAGGVSLLLSQEFRQPFGADLTLPVEEMAAAVDNIVLLRYREDGHRLRRLISVLKLREHAYRADIRAFSITGEGIHVDGTPRDGDVLGDDIAEDGITRDAGGPLAPSGPRSA